MSTKGSQIRFSPTAICQGTQGGIQRRIEIFRDVLREDAVGG
jgi:hypothetical protein